MDFKSLEDISKTLNQESDNLNQQIKQVELKLKGLNLGIEAFVPTPNFILGYGKVNNKWCLYITENNERIELVNASRQTRMLSFTELESLFLELCKEAKLLTAEIGEKIKYLKDFLSKISPEK